MNLTVYATALAMTGVLSATSVLADSCSDLTTLNLYKVDISKAQHQAAGTLPPDPMSAMTGGSPKELNVGEHCLVEGQIDSRQGVNGEYGINFQLRMSDSWNGRFLFQGGGGMDGFIAPAIGSIPSTGSTATPALSRGYAVVSMNGGHNGMDASFALDQQARLDLAYASIGKVTDTAKILIKQRYKKLPEQSYFMGCSNGGREAMMAAQRFPTEFDGIIAGNPGFHLSRASLTQAWDVETFMSVAPAGDLANAFTQKELDLVSAEILKQCDSLDGLSDNIVASSCDFDPSALNNQIDKNKIHALLKVMSGPKASTGESLYSDWPWDPGINSAGWRAWKLGTSQRPAMNQSIGPASLTKLFATPPLDKLPKHLNFDEMATNVSSVGGYFDADETFMSTFAHNGGKMVIFQGMADPVFSANDIARWYNRTNAITPNTVRLFMVPGMTHCGGGNVTFEDFDPLTLLENWKSSGRAPENMPAKAPSMPNKTMPLCAYPTYAKYNGGDKNSLKGFTCVNPE